MTSDKERMRARRNEDEQAPHLRLARYWRDCLADAGLGKGRFEDRDLPAENTRRLEVSAEELQTGCLGTGTLKRLFSRVDEKQDIAHIRFWPLLFSRRTSHGTSRMDGWPAHVAPIVATARVGRHDGRIWPMRTVLARDVLEPLGGRMFSIGSMEDLDTFLSESPIHPAAEDESHERMWQRYGQDCRRLREKVTGGWPGEEDEYQSRRIGMIEFAGDTAATVRNIVALYDKALEAKPKAPLFASYAMDRPAKAAPGPDRPYRLASLLGHSSDRFPLADGQRDALAHLAVAREGEILAVNGPPGTGKTTLLLSAIAGEWVRAALAGGEPPVIAASSANNQAITNVIDAFRESFAKGKGPFAGRWLPGIASFGLFLPAYRREREARDRGYQTETSFAEWETRGYVVKARKDYLARAAKALPELERADVQGVVDALRARIEKAAGKLDAADAARVGLEAARREVAALLGDDPEKAVTELEADRERGAQQDAAARSLLDGWKAYLAQESVWLAFFSFIPPVARKRRDKARYFLEGAGYGTTDAGLRIEAVEGELDRRSRDCRERLCAAAAAADRARTAMDGLERAYETFAGAAEALGAGEVDPDDPGALERTADVGIRFHLFQLATHYWEGRWLIETDRILPDIDRTRTKTGETTAVPRWRRWMMLTPCMVATFAMLPDKLSVSRKEDGGFRKDYLFNFLDLLIVDEAGQVPPDVAGAAFALAKKALVIGDTRQIEPIHQIPKFIDIGNLIERGLLPTDHTEEDFERVEDTGRTASGGSAMKAAQRACRYRPEPGLDGGLWLFEHRRCYDEIVEYCNALCYRGKLEPRRGPAPDIGEAEEQAIPGPLAYLHVDGLCTPAGGSRRNMVEAKTIAAWLAAARDKLEARYAGTKKRLEKIVGIVTPFARQANEIREACRAVGIAVSGADGMTIGTIHSLQGADREIVIFSPTYSKHEDGGFIDGSTSMLNVAVSRAKDAFLVFGDMDLFSTARPGSPRQLLGQFLFAHPENAMSFQAIERKDLARPGQEIRTLRDAGEHDAFLLELLGAAGSAKVNIVSPWIVVRTMEEEGILTALEAARKRGKEIDIYIDPGLNDEKDRHGVSSLDRARSALTAIDVELKLVRQLHSKIVFADEEVLSVGSFNWLSARRSGDFARHETSLVYSGPHLSGEIEVIAASLKRRAIVDAS